MKAIAKELLLGVAVGDALGVPFEFLSRERMALSPAKDMVGHGTHNQLPGTWSDDSSLTFCLAEAMVKDYGLVHTAENFVKWRNKGYWTARNSVFDIGMTTTDAISDLYDLLEQKRYRDLRLLKYQAEEYDNGNGSLMRILPLVFETMGKPIKAQFELVWDNSSLTHRHIRAGMSCMIYLRFAEHLIAGLDKTAAYQKTREDILQLWKEIEFADREQGHFKRVIQTDISTYEEDTILSGGYVIESLEASFWCILKTTSYEEAVLKAINFGHDTDTTAAITGGLAGLLYGSDSIPEFWLVSLARLEDIIDLADRLAHKYRKR